MNFCIGSAKLVRFESLEFVVNFFSDSLWISWFSLKMSIHLCFFFLLKLDEVVQSPTHVMVVEMRSSFRVLVLRAGVIIEVDSLVVIVVELLVIILISGLSVFILFNIVRTVLLFVHSSVCFVGVEIILLIPVRGVSYIVANVSMHSSLHLD